MNQDALAFQTVDPATGEPGRRYRGHSLDEAADIIFAAREAQRAWRRVAFPERAHLMRRAAEAIRANRDRYAALMTAEMGKTLRDGHDELEKCAWSCEYFADHAEMFLARRPQDMSERPPPGGPPKAFVTYNPLGVVLAIMPWNFPFWQAVRFAAPNLMAGNGAVLKHASNVPGCALALEEIFRDAGFPEDLFRTVLVGSRDVRPLIEDPRIAAVTLTGSVPAGRSVAAIAGGVLKKTVLELGGSDAYVVLQDADPAAAAKVCVAGRMVNGGQSCIAAKRFIVHESLQGAFEAAVVAEMETYPLGDPTSLDTRLGPMESVEARDRIADQVERSLAAGARLLLGGEIPNRPGAWYPATVLTDVRPGQPAHDEEVFGPVAAIITAKDETDAIRIANDSEFGLGAAVISRDVARAERLAAEEVDAGMVFVNQNVRSDPRLPFGGVKDSGYGREVSEFGIREFCNIKTVVVHG
jgi:succinate-semialdehyde dehydrogenase/glutarate-semialdehyde dehydrogenase